MSTSTKDIITENIDVDVYINEYVKDLKYKDIVVNSLDEALELTQAYQSTSEYDWFRGQSGIWPLIPSANRLDPQKRIQAEKSLQRLDAWAFKNGISTDTDYVEAIAQHYHMPTLFIDFTTDPKIAAYFAAQKSGNEPNEYSCMYCLNSHNFNESIESIKKYFPNLPSYPKLLDINVNNLWRLEAQKGKFMYQPIVNLDWFYSLKRIVFKNKKNTSQYFDMSHIYPTAKSVLEERLDGFFLNERTGESLEQLNGLLNRLAVSGMEFTTINLNEIPFFSQAYIKEYVHENILLNFKWDESEIKLWKNDKIEKFANVQTTESFNLKIKSFRNINENKNIVYDQLIKFLNDQQDIRTKAINFSIKDDEKNIKLINKFEQYSNIIWNGMRKLPYENHEIAEVISKVIFLMNFSISEYRKSDKNFLKIGINDGCGGFNNAFVNENLLFKAMRDDLYDVLKETHQNIESIIFWIKIPKLLYKFDALKNLFVESIIISQVVYGGNNFVIFSPCELEILGLP